MAQNDERFEQLKQKYQSVLKAIEQHQVRLQNLHVQDNKLFIRGEAPSDEAKNRVWDQIKVVDATYSDLTADITINPSLAAKTQTAGASVSGGQSTRKYTVKSGDTLSKISREFYGDANQYMRIFNANRDHLTDPNKIKVGEDLVIPE